MDVVRWKAVEFVRGWTAGDGGITTRRFLVVRVEQTVPMEQRNAQEAARLKAQMRSRFMSAPGVTVAAFEKAWPELPKAIQINHALRGQPRVEEDAAMRRSGRSAPLGRID
jgi:hypothetical protein